MFNLIRPDAAQTLRRWSEVLMSIAVLGLGIYWAFASFGVVRWIGYAVAALGVALLWSAWQRARFTARGVGPGVVQVVEAEIRYFGPRGGGFAAISAILALRLSADGAFWLLETEDGEILVVPRAAKGAEALFDAFSLLPGLEMERLLQIVAQGPAPKARMIWQRSARTLLT